MEQVSVLLATIFPAISSGDELLRPVREQHVFGEHVTAKM